MTDHFRPIIKRWPTAVELASDLGASEMNVRQWLRSDSIPAPWFASVVRAAHRRGFQDITADSLSALAERRRMARDADSRNRVA